MSGYYAGPPAILYNQHKLALIKGKSITVYKKGTGETRAEWSVSFLFPGIGLTTLLDDNGPLDRVGRTI